MRIIAIIIPLMWGTLIFGHGKEKHEPTPAVCAVIGGSST